MTMTTIDTTIGELETAVSTDPRVRVVIETAGTFDITQLAVVGGFVRDRLLATDDNRANSYHVRQHLQRDMVGAMEIIGEGVNLAMADHVAAALGGSVDRLTDMDFVIRSDAGVLNLGAARTATYPLGDGVPVHIEASLVEDLGRRDFTFNAMAVRLDPFDGSAMFFDPLGGRGDLETGTVRALSGDSYMTDVALVIRALRETERFGFKLDNRDVELLAPAIYRMVQRLAPARLGAEFRMAWAVLDNLQMTRLTHRLVDLGFYPQMDETMTGADLLKVALEDPQIPYQVAEAHTTATTAATFTGLLLADPDRATEVANRLGMTQNETEMFRDTAELAASMSRLLDPTVPHSERHRELLSRQVLSILAADLALNGGDTSQSQVHFYMERMGRYGSDYRFGQNRINIELEVSDIVDLGASDEDARRLMLELIDAKLDWTVGYRRQDELEFVRDRLTDEG